MNIVDIIIAILLILSVIGTVLAFVLALFLKTPVSIFMYEHFPFFSIGGVFENITVFNILIYEGLSFILTFSIILVLFSIIGKVTGLVDKILSKLVLLGLPSKILGGIVGFIQGYLIIFLILFLISSFTKPSQYILDSKLSSIIQEGTPLLSEVASKTTNSVTEIYDICVNNADREKANLESLDVLMKYNILNYESANKLVESGKLKIENASSVIEKYKETK